MKVTGTHILITKNNIYENTCSGIFLQNEANPTIMNIKLICSASENILILLASKDYLNFEGSWKNTSKSGTISGTLTSNSIPNLHFYVLLTKWKDKLKNEGLWIFKLSRSN